MKRLKPLFFFVLFLQCLMSFAQAQPKLKDIVSAMDTLQSKLPIEKVYLQTDKSSYFKGDTLWFKAYLFNAAYLSASAQSAFLYVELESDSNTMVRHWRFPVAAGLSRGQIILDENSFPEGSYTLTAFTNWMRNFGEDYVFIKQFHIGPAASESWLIDVQTRLLSEAGAERLNMRLQLRKPNRETLGLREVEIKVSDGRQELYRQTGHTLADGTMDISFGLPPNTVAKKLSVTVTDLLKGAGNRKIVIPVPLNRATNTDLQFLPEGGAIVAGLMCKIGFKAIGEDGKGTDVAGKIYDSGDKEICRFKSLHKGMGSFEITPQAGEHYTAKLISPEGSFKSYPLPEVKLSGTQLSIENPGHRDSIMIKVSASAEIIQSNDAYYLMGQSRGIVCYAATINLKEGINRSVLNKNLFPGGIARFTLLNKDKLPLNERVIYIDHQDNLKVKITPDKQAYCVRDSIALSIQVKDKDGRPVQGSFSLSVTDDSQVRADTACHNSIITNMLLTADLKGTVEEPGYYQNSSDPQRWQALDNLLLTQGWTGYDWKDVFNLPVPKYTAQSETWITGRVMDGDYKPLTGAKLSLLSERPIYKANTNSDSRGNFVFTGVPANGSWFRINATKANGSKFTECRVFADEIKPLIYNPSRGNRIMPWYVNCDTAMLAYWRHKDKAALNERLFSLNAVSIKDKEITIREKEAKSIRNWELNGNADQVLEEEDIRKMGDISLYQLLRQRAKGLHVGKGFPTQYTVSPTETFMINKNYLIIYFDLIEINAQAVESPGFVKKGFELYPAKKIRRIQVTYNDRPNEVYAIMNINTMSGRDYLVHTTPQYIDVSANEIRWTAEHQTNGMYVYRPWPIALPKQFYSPRYTIKTNNTGIGTDTRSTIYWAPDIITDKEGKALVSFYAADIPGSYTLTVEGSDMNGNIGSIRQMIKIKSTK
ncbi:MAG: hypothetical protein ABIN91_23195 [Mucilaginibacter sp.]|uniref:hypothetical protein n=1 Tax=Mucilaginibacter sp. TaxID=1882438 RepID=UPI00326739E2